jgi:hypothetical protein
MKAIILIASFFVIIFLIYLFILRPLCKAIKYHDDQELECYDDSNEFMMKL